MFIRQVITASVLFAAASLAVGQTYTGAACDGGCNAGYYGPPGGAGYGANRMGSPPSARPGPAHFGGGNGYHPGASAYGAGGQPAFPGGVWPGMDGGYQDLGGTCCGPHWFDVMVEAVLLKRTGDDTVGMMSQGIRGFAPPNIVLGSDDIDFDLAPAFRFTAHWQLNAVYFIEGIYLGGLDWEDSAGVSSNNNDLFSAFSDFGTQPFGGFEATDQAARSSLFYESQLDGVEANFRRGWITPNYKCSGTWLIGARYLRLEDQLRQDIAVEPHFDPINMVDRDAAASRYDIDVENDLTGVQAGAELVRSLWPGLLIGGEGKFMALANRASQVAALESTTLQPALIEADDTTDFSWGTEARLFCIWQFHPWMKLRAGYELLFLGDVATAFGNYDSTPPFANPSVSQVRSGLIRNDQDLLFHGFSVGLELGW